eukprot:scaffold44792_cov34-Cyclotella_meneghiniana.AAC.3
MQAQASNIRRQHSLRTSKSRASFIESIAAIHLESHRESSPQSSRRNTSDGIVESERRLRVPPRKTKSSIVTLPGRFQMSLKNELEAEPVRTSSILPGCISILNEKKNRHSAYAHGAPLSTADQPMDDNIVCPAVVKSSNRQSLKMSSPTPSPPMTNSDQRPSSKKIHPVDSVPVRASPTMPECVSDHKKNKYECVAPSVTRSSHRRSFKMSFPTPPPQSGKKVHPVETSQVDTNIASKHESSQVRKKYEPKAYKESERCCFSSTKQYTIGDIAQCSSHMTIENCPRAALINVCHMKTHDFAFVKRSDGKWTYSILAGQGQDCDNNEIMIFVTSEKGRTKAIKMRDWAKLIRPVAVAASDGDVSEEYLLDVPRIIIVRNNDDYYDWNCSRLSINV